MVASVLAQVIDLFFAVFSLLMLARILVSWFNPDPYSPIMRFLYNVTEPVLAPVRRVLPPVGMFDLSPMVVLIGAIVLERVLIAMVYALF